MFKKAVKSACNISFLCWAVCCILFKISICCCTSCNIHSGGSFVEDALLLLDCRPEGVNRVHSGHCDVGDCAVGVGVRDVEGVGVGVHDAEGVAVGISDME